MAKLRYGRACMLEKKENYYTKLSNNTTTLNDRNDAPLSNAKIQEVILKVMMEDEEESTTDANNITADEFSHGSSSKRENEEAIFISEKLDKSDELVDEINKSTINNSGYELNKATASEAQGNLTSYLETVNQTSNGILTKNY